MSIVTIDQCVEVLRNKLRSDHFSIDTYKLEHSKRFLGFCSTQAKLIITATVQGQQESYNFFVKAATKRTNLNERFWKVQKVFLKECLVRDHLVPDLSKYAVDKITADSYWTDPESFIIMEDLDYLGYELCREKCLTLEHARLGMKALANLHASSICLQEHSSESLRIKYSTTFFETFITFPNGRNFPCLLYSIESHLRFLSEQLVDKFDSETKSKIIELAIDRAQYLVQPSKKHLNVICHGDAWGNNMLYSYNSDGTPTGTILVDFQAVRYAPPATDIIQYMYTSFPSELRSLHFDELIAMYYENLSNFLLQRKVDVDDILTEKDFLQSTEDYKEFGVLIKACYMLTRLPCESLTLMSESEEKYLDALIYGSPAIFDHAFHVSKEYKNDVIACITEILEFYSNWFKPS